MVTIGRNLEGSNGKGTLGILARQSKPWSLVLLLLVMGLAGCVGTQPAAPAALPSDAAPEVISKDGRDLRRDLKPTDSLEAPRWELGEWFAHHVYLGADDENGLHYEAIYVEDHGDKYFLATPDKQAAKDEALWDLPILGEINKADLGMKGLGVEWNLYQFPLTDGAKWHRTIQFPDDVLFGTFITYEVDFTATYNGQISTPQGPRPGFDIAGLLPDGTAIYRFDYVPDIGWYAHFYGYDVSTPDPEDWFFHVMSMGHGKKWSGTYYVDTSKNLVQHFNALGVDPDDPTHPYLEPATHALFTVSSSATYLIGYLFSFAFAGAHETLLFDPDNQLHQFQALGAPFGYEGEWMDDAALAGDWKLVTVGAGLQVGGGAFLWEVTETAHTFGK